jgi:hypothetical protein
VASEVRPLGESRTFESFGLPSELTALVLHTVNVAADVARVAPGDLTDAQLAEACSSPEGQAGDIIVLMGCTQLKDMSSLAKLEQMQMLDISGCNSMNVSTLSTVIAAHK